MAEVRLGGAGASVSCARRRGDAVADCIYRTGEFSEDKATYEQLIAAGMLVEHFRGRGGMVRGGQRREVEAARGCAEGRPDVQVGSLKIKQDNA